MPNSDNLTPRQRAAIPRLIAAASIEAGCRAARISKSSYYQWMDRPAFRDALQLASRRRFESDLQSLKNQTQRALSVLYTLMDSENEFVALRASTAILGHSMALFDMENITERLDRLEARFRP